MRLWAIFLSFHFFSKYIITNYIIFMTEMYLFFIYSIFVFLTFLLLFNYSCLHLPPTTPPTPPPLPPTPAIHFLVTCYLAFMCQNIIYFFSVVDSQFYAIVIQEDDFNFPEFVKAYFFVLPCGLSLIMFHVHLGRIYILLLCEEIFCKYQLNLFDLVCHLRYHLWLLICHRNKLQ